MYTLGIHWPDLTKQGYHAAPRDREVLWQTFLVNNDRLQTWDSRDADEGEVLIGTPTLRCGLIHYWMEGAGGYGR